MLSLQILSSSLVLLFCGIFLAPLANADEASEWISSLRSQDLDPQSESKTKQDEFGQTPKLSPTVNVHNPGSLRSHAASRLKDGDFDAAIKLIEQAIEFYPEDPESRQIYADALEAKLKDKSVRDPHVFNLCVKQWYYLYKNSPDPAIANAAGEHLRALTKKSPFVYPTAKMYLSRVLLPEIYDASQAQSPASISEEPQQVR